MNKVKFYILQNALALDQLGNTILGGYADETISSRCYRGYIHGSRIATFFKYWIDRLFYALADEVDHCKNAYVAERRGTQLPEELR